MATVYVPDDVLMAYAAECGGPAEAKQEIQRIIEANSPGGGGGGE
jgi:hypothetical protein